MAGGYLKSLQDWFRSLGSCVVSGLVFEAGRILLMICRLLEPAAGSFENLIAMDGYGQTFSQSAKSSRLVSR